MTPPTHIEFRLTREEALILVAIANLGGIFIREGPPMETPKGCLTFEIHNHDDLTSMKAYHSCIDMLGFAALLKDIDMGASPKLVPENHNFHEGIVRSYELSRTILARLCKAAHVEAVAT
jgi:hypothetical protein